MKKEIKKILTEELVKLGTTKICIFDFDGTLVDTPMKETGVLQWEKAKQLEWVDKGWWSNPKSLDMEVFDIPVMHETVHAYNEAKKDPKTLMVMMTGRVTKVSSYVKAVLDHYNLKFDMYLYNTGGDTLYVKLKYLDELLAAYPNVEDIHLWEDRIPHVQAFKQWGASKHINFELTIVKSGHHD